MIKRTLIAIFMLGFLVSPVMATVDIKKPKIAKKLNMVVLGDSFSAGNGAGNYVGIDGCYRSTRNWGNIYNNLLQRRDINVTYQNRACSGANISHLANSKKDMDKTKLRSTLLIGKVSRQEALNKLRSRRACANQTLDEDTKASFMIEKTNFRPSSNQTLVTYSCQHQLRPQLDFITNETDLVLLTIGGNNFDFSGIVTDCFFFNNSKACQKKINLGFSKINQKLYEKTFAALESIVDKGLRPEAKVALIGYPLMSLDDNQYLKNFNISATIRKLGKDANNIQRQAVTDFNKKHSNQAVFIDVQKDFAGHEPDNSIRNNPRRWLTDFFEPGFNMTEWYHPNNDGQYAYAQAINRALDIDKVIKPVSVKAADADLVFNIDTTGSMDNDIESVKSNINKIIDVVNAKSNSARYAITTFSAYEDYKNPARLKLDFTRDIDLFKDTLSKIQIHDNGTEPNYSGIMMGLNLNWRPGVHKSVITLTDEPPENEEPYTGLNAQKIIDKAFAVDPAELYFVNTGYSNSEYDQIATATGGKVFNTDSTNVASSFLKSINMILSKPHAWLNGPFVAKYNQKVIFDAGGSYAKDGKIIKYEWDYDSDGIYEDITTEPKITKTFNRDYDGLMTVRVTDNNGLSNIANTWLSVSLDGDNVHQEIDNCPNVSNPDQADHNQDGVGDACDKGYMDDIKKTYQQNINNATVERKDEIETQEQHTPSSEFTAVEIPPDTKKPTSDNFVIKKPALLHSPTVIEQSLTLAIKPTVKKALEKASNKMPEKLSNEEFVSKKDSDLKPRERKEFDEAPYWIIGFFVLIPIAFGGATFAARLVR